MLCFKVALTGLQPRWKHQCHTQTHWMLQWLCRHPHLELSVKRTSLGKFLNFFNIFMKCRTKLQAEICYLWTEFWSLFPTKVCYHWRKKACSYYCLCTVQGIGVCSYELGVLSENTCIQWVLLNFEFYTHTHRYMVSALHFFAVWQRWWD